MDIKHAVKNKLSYSQETDNKALSVNTTNALSRASHGLSLNEKRLIAMSIGKIDSLKSGFRQHNGQQMRVKITAQEFSDMFSVSDKSVYRHLINACDNLMKRYVRIIEKTSKGRKEIKFSWVSGVIYHHGEGWVEIGFSNEITPHLTLIRGQYTSYKLNSATALRSVYSWRLFELFMSVSVIKNDLKGQLYITLEDFRHSLEVPDSYKFNDIKRRIIEPSCQEINNIHHIKTTWKPSKKGRSITSLLFYFDKESQQESAPSDEKDNLIAVKRCPDTMDMFG